MLKPFSVGSIQIKSDPSYVKHTIVKLFNPSQVSEKMLCSNSHAMLPELCNCSSSEPVICKQ